MLISLLRRHMKIILLSLLVLIVPGFILWGVGSALVARTNNYAGHVFEQRISLEQYNDTNRAVNINNQLRFGRFYDMFKAYLNPNRQTWERLALLTYTQTYFSSLTVFPTEVVSSIENNPIFQDEETKQFSKALFFQITSQYFRMRMPQFENIVYTNLLLDKIRLMNQPTFPVTIAKIKEKLLENYRKSKALIYVATFEQFESQFKEDENEITEYYNDNKLSLYSKEKRRVRFLEFDPRLLDVDTIVDDEEALAYYNDNISQFRDFSKEDSPEKPFEDVKGTIETRIVQERSKQAGQNWAYDVIDSLEEGDSLYVAERRSSLAVQVSPYFESTEHPSNSFINAIREISFSLNQLGVSEPIFFNNKFYVLQLDDLIPPKEQPIESVRNSIVEVLKNNFIREQSRQSISSLQDILKDSPSEDTSALLTELSIQKKESDWLSLSDTQSSSEYPQTFLDFLFTSSAQQTSSIIEFSDGYGLAVCLEHQEQTLENVEESQYKTTRDNLSREENNELTSSWLDSIYKLSHTKTNERFFNERHPLETKRQGFNF